jgi:hypothetical protein
MNELLARAKECRAIAVLGLIKALVGGCISLYSIRISPKINHEDALTAFGALTHEQIWKTGTQWMDTDNSSAFSLVREQLRTE